MEKKIIESKQAPAPVGPYSQALEVDGFIFCSGQIPLDPQSGEMLRGSIAEQTRRSMDNLGAVLKAAAVDFSHVIKTTIFLTNMDDFGAMNEVYAEYFPSQPPARSCVGVLSLPKGSNFEIEVLAKR